MAARFTVFVRSGCHLCEEMLQALAESRKKWDFQEDVVDIQGDPLLEARYGTRVPVLTAGDEELCYYFLDQSVLQQYFDKS